MAGGSSDSDRRSTRQWIFAIAVVGVALRLAFSLLYWVDQPLTRDEREYLSLARSLASGQGFVYDADVLNGSVQPFGRAPGYPVFLALVGVGHSSTTTVPASVKVAQSLLGGLGVLLVATLAGRFSGPRAALIAAAIAAAYPPLVWVSAYAFSEALFWPLGLLVAWLFDRALGGSSHRLSLLGVGVGALTGGAILVRGAMLLFAGLAWLWLLSSRRFALAVAFTLGTALVLAPWAIRNQQHHGRFVLVASEGGVTFWTGNHPLASGDGDMAANPAIKLDSQRLRSAHPDLTEEQMEPVYYREALRWILQHPIAWLALEARKAFYLVVPIGPSYTLHSTRYVALSWLAYGAVLPLALAGFAGAGERRARVPGLWLLAASAVVSALVFFPQERFRVPILDPTLIVCAAAYLGHRRQGRLT
jgi:4-amino-4-deoxy-L-arabinose transferase-like glycosyltransferase